MRFSLLKRPGTVYSPAPEKFRRRLSDAERLTAGWIGLAVVLLVARLWVLRLATKAGHHETWPVAWLPLAAYQDLCLVVIAAWLSDGLLRITSRPIARWLVRAFAWSACFVAAWYAVASAEIFSLLNTPLTYRLIAMSDNLRGIRSSMEAALTHRRIMTVVSAPLVVLLLAMLLARFGATLVTRLRAVFARGYSWGAFGTYVAIAVLATRSAGLDQTWVANPHWALTASLWDRNDPFLSGDFSESHLEDFHRTSSPEGSGFSDWHGRAKGSNILLVVMESVGSQWLSHYGAPYKTTPELSRLAERGLTFERIYASQPYTSNSMTGLFCSLYPWHGWRSIPRRAPELRVSGLGNVLEHQGYRTALLHTGDMKFDNEKWFLQKHGFAEVHDVWSLDTLVKEDGPDAGVPAETPGVHLHLPDQLLMPAALHWIDANRSSPFFLALWTIQTHHPYFAEPSQKQFVDDDPELNRYLNAIRVSDQLLGDLMRELEARGLADNTLVVVIGDHGESFGQHAHRGHSQTLYEEELRIPLVLISPRLAERPERYRVLGQQLDLAPTLLELLGLDAPEEWQGRSLFAGDRTNRAYSFTAFHHYLFAVIEGDRKYIYNFTTGREQLYDLRSDPTERFDLARAAAERPLRDELHRRLASWAHFQNEYLGQFVPPR